MQGTGIGGKRPTIDALTGLRFVAALLVYTSHLDLTPFHLPTTITAIPFAGFNGVTLFFILSGFVICYNYYDAMRGQWLSLNPSKPSSKMGQDSD